jgi:hypothetical protein
MLFLESAISIDYLEEYIIIETGLFISPVIEKFESEFSVEIFKLDQHFWPAFLDCFHEFFDEFLCFFVWNSFLSETEVKRVLEILFIVCTVVENNLLSITSYEIRTGRVRLG